MKLMGLAGAVALIGGGFYVHGPIGGGEVYPIPAADALERVQVVELHGRVKGMLIEAGGSVEGSDVERALVPGKSVIFTFKVKGKKVGSYTVSVDPVDANSSRVATDFEMEADAEDNMKGIMIPMAKQFTIVGNAMVSESVDAALDGRPYNRDVDRNAMIEYTAANPGEIMKGANDTMDKAVAEMKEHRGSSAGYNYGKGDQPTFVPGQPMVNPNPNGR